MHFIKSNCVEMESEEDSLARLEAEDSERDKQIMLEQKSLELLEEEDRKREARAAHRRKKEILEQWQHEHIPGHANKRFCIRCGVRDEHRDVYQDVYEDVYQTMDECVEKLPDEDAMLFDSIVAAEDIDCETLKWCRDDQTKLWAGYKTRVPEFALREKWRLWVCPRCSVRFTERLCQGAILGGYIPQLARIMLTYADVDQILLRYLKKRRDNNRIICDKFHLNNIKESVANIVPDAMRGVDTVLDLDDTFDQISRELNVWKMRAYGDRVEMSSETHIDTDVILDELNRFNPYCEIKDKMDARARAMPLDNYVRKCLRNRDHSEQALQKEFGKSMRLLETAYDDTRSEIADVAYWSMENRKPYRVRAMKKTLATKADWD